MLEISKRDILLLRGYEKGEYLDIALLAEVTYILKEFEGLQEGYVVLGIKILNRN